MQKGDIVLIPFPFTDLTGNKKRPALILVPGGLDITVSFISSQLHWQDPTDLLLQPNITNGLKTPSLVRVGKIATVDKALVLGKLGNISAEEIEELDKKLLHSVTRICATAIALASVLLLMPHAFLQKSYSTPSGLLYIQIRLPPQAPPGVIDIEALQASSPQM